MGARGENVKERVEVERGIVAAPLSESQWNRGHKSVKKWESEKYNSWCMSVEGFGCHVATDGSLLGKARKWRACGWALVQLDYDEEMGPLLGMYGPVEAEYEVQRTIKRAELTAFFCLLKRVIGPVRVHVDNKGIIDGLRRGESERIRPRTGDADLWIKLGRITWSCRKRHFGGSGACKKRQPDARGTGKNGNKGPTRRRKIVSGKEGITSQTLSEGDRTKTLVSPKVRT